jgi:hypothetical protein
MSLCRVSPKASARLSSYNGRIDQIPIQLGWVLKLPSAGSTECVADIDREIDNLGG